MVLAVLLFVYLAYSIRWAIQARFSAELDASGTARHTTGEMVRQGAWFVVGAVLVIVGSKLLVASAEVLAGRLGVPELIVGLTVLAVGTSLPEYAISLISVVKGHGALGVGNIIGANVLNICWVVASCALLSPLPIQRQTIQLDGPVMLVLMVMLLVASRSADRITMRAGAAVFSVYLAYLAAMFALFR
jgi:cation:H+ antiporter